MAWHNNKTPLSGNSYTVTVNVSPALKRMWLRGADKINNQMIDSITANTMMLKGKIQQVAPVGVFGILRKSIANKTEFKRSNDTVTGRIYPKPNAHYAIFVERGTKGQFRMPPRENIRRWVQRKISHADEVDLNRKTFLIAKKIKQKGIKAQWYMFKTFLGEKENIIKSVVNAVSRAKI